MEISQLSVCSLDTNVLLRWILGDNPEQLEIVNKILEAKEIKKIHISNLVLVESVWVMESVYKMDRDQVAEALEVILSYPKFSLEKDLLKQIISIYPTKTRLSFVDIMLAVESKINSHSPLLTFDKKLAKSWDFVYLLGLGE